jgi:serine/threonine-protein kinase
VLAVIAVFALAAFGTAYLLGNRNKIDVPNVVDKQRTLAVSTLEGQGFRVKVTTMPGDAATAGRVVSQTPSGGTSVDTGSLVTLTVNAGPNTVRVPEFEGKTFEAAQQLAQQSKLQLATPVQRSSDQPQGTVLTQDPPAGQEVNEGTTVQLEVSKGDLAVVPPVVGKTRDQAVEAIGQAGFRADVRFEQSADVPEGQVIRQVPQAGSKKPKNSRVQIVVATAPTASPSPSGSVTPSAPASGFPF